MIEHLSLLTQVLFRCVLDGIDYYATHSKLPKLPIPQLDVLEEFQDMGPSEIFWSQGTEFWAEFLETDPLGIQFWDTLIRYCKRDLGLVISHAEMHSPMLNNLPVSTLSMDETLQQLRGLVSPEEEEEGEEEDDYFRPGAFLVSVGIDLIKGIGVALADLDGHVRPEEALPAILGTVLQEWEKSSFQESTPLDLDFSDDAGKKAWISQTATTVTNILVEMPWWKLQPENQS